MCVLVGFIVALKLCFVFKFIIAVLQKYCIYLEERGRTFNIFFIYLSSIVELSIVNLHRIVENISNEQIWSAREIHGLCVTEESMYNVEYNICSYKIHEHIRLNKVLLYT